MGIFACDSAELVDLSLGINRNEAHLGADEQVPSLDEMPTQVPSWLTDYLNTDIVP
jgi:hypothetical protein